MRALRTTLTRLAIIAGVCFPASPAAAQDLSFLREVGPPRVGLKDWEASLPPPDSATLRRLGFCPEVASADQFFHWIDVDGDALPDLVYTGLVVMCGPSPEGMHTVIYLNRGERLVLAFEGGGEITRMWRPVPGQPVSFLLRSSFGDGPQVTYYDQYVPHRDADRIEFQEMGRFVAADSTRPPQRYLRQPVPVRVVWDSVALRGMRDLKPESVAAVYRAGSKGMALAEATSPGGRRWLFVAMEPLARDSEYVVTLPGERPPTLLGWLEARSVTQTPLIRPGARVTETHPFGTQPGPDAAMVSAPSSRHAP